MLGKGWQEYCDWRVSSEQILSTKLEKIARHCIYFGRQHVTCHLTNKDYSDKLKIGRAKYANTIQRGRNQGGGDFRIYGEITLEFKSDTRTCETLIGLMLKERNINGSQNQTELYDILNHEIPDLLQSCMNLIDTKTNINIIDYGLFVPCTTGIIKPQPRLIPASILCFT